MNSSCSQTENDLLISLLKNKRFSEAISHIRKLNEKRPDPQNITTLACAYQQADRHDEAIEQFEYLLDSTGMIASDRAAISERLAFSLLATQQHEKAAQIFKKAISLSENMPLAHVGLGLCMVEVGKTAEARSSFERAISIDKDCSDAYNNLGALAWSEKCFDEALRVFKHALEIDPFHKDALPNYLSLLYALDLYDEAASLLFCYVEGAPENADLAYHLAYCHMKLGNEQEACTLLRKILDDHPGHEAASALLETCKTP